MNLDLTRRWIERWEGRRALVYQDSAGIPTIGIGANLLAAATQKGIAALGLNYAQVAGGAVALTDAQIDTLFGISLDGALASIRRLCITFDSFPEPQQIVLADLAFNLGEARLAAFVKTLGYVRRQMWVNAAAELQNSAWFGQVGSKPGQRGWADVMVLGGTMTVEQILDGRH